MVLINVMFGDQVLTALLQLGVSSPIFLGFFMSRPAALGPTSSSKKCSEAKEARGTCGAHRQGKSGPRVQNA